MSTTASTKAFVGIWWNHLDNFPVLTLQDREAGILSAALVIFIGFVASQAWNIVRFALHQSRSRSRSPLYSAKRDDDNNNNDGLYLYLHRQQQLALRNGAGHAHALWLSARLALGWRRQVGGWTAFRRCFSVMAVSFLSLAGWSAARLFVSLIWTAAGDQFLIALPPAGAGCGWMFPQLSVRTDQEQLLTVYQSNRMDSAAIYEAQCYADRLREGGGGPECERFAVPRIAWTAEDAPCPFADPTLCTAVNSVPVRMDTGYVNSNAHLGVNAAPEDTVEFRKTATCSPMLSGYAVFENGTSIYNSTFRYYYGPTADSPATYTYPAKWLENTGNYRIWYVSRSPSSHLTRIRGAAQPFRP